MGNSAQRDASLWVPEHAVITTLPAQGADWPIHRYRSAGGVAVSAGKVLLLRRPRKREVRLPKGHVEARETDAACALREVREESGLEHPRLVLHLGTVENHFGYRRTHFVRSEVWYLLTTDDPHCGRHERQFEPLWIALADAPSLLSFEAERVPVRWASAALERGALQGVE